MTRTSRPSPINTRCSKPFYRVLVLLAGFLLLTACTHDLEPDAGIDPAPGPALDSFVNYTGEVLTEFITDIEVGGEVWQIVPVKDFDYSQGGQHVLFYIVDEQKKAIKMILDNPATLNEKWFVIIETIHVLDLTHDGRDDILIEFTYPIGFTKFAGHTLSTYEVYLQEDRWRTRFTYDIDLSRKIEETLWQEMRLVNNDAEADNEYIPDAAFVIDWIRQQFAEG